MKKVFTFVLVALVVLMVTSCASSLSVAYNQPSNINMSRYQNIAIASTQSYNGNYRSPFFIRNMIFENGIPRYELYATSYNFSTVNNAVSKYVDKMVMGAFTHSASNGYYHVLDTMQTDTYLSLARIGRDAFKELRSAGYDAVLIPRVSVLDLDEFISAEWTKDKNNNKVAKYYVERVMTVSITLSVVDTTTGQIAVQRTYTDKIADKTTFDPVKTTFFSDIFSYRLVDACLYDMGSDILNDFVPTIRTTSISLMANKPKLPELETAYDASKHGDLDLALRIFRNTYETSGHIAAGYNAAVILAAQNDIEDALLVLDDIRRKSARNSKVNDLYSRLRLLQEKNVQAASQMSSSSSVPAEVANQQNVLDYLLN